MLDRGHDKGFSTVPENDPHFITADGFVSFKP